MSQLQYPLTWSEGVPMMNTKNVDNTLNVYAKLDAGVAAKVSKSGWVARAKAVEHLLNTNP